MLWLGAVGVMWGSLHGLHLGTPANPSDLGPSLLALNLGLFHSEKGEAEEKRHFWLFLSPRNCSQPCLGALLGVARLLTFGPQKDNDDIVSGWWLGMG